MGTITTAVANTAKRELLASAFCFMAPVTKTGVNGVNGAFTLTGLADVSGIYVGMAVSGSNVAAGAVVASIDSTTQVTVSKAHTGTITSQSITFTGDQIKIALIKPSPTGNYNKSTTVYADLTGNSDEISGTGYTPGGLALTNVSPVLSGDTALIDFAPDPSWTGASFSTIGDILYNNTQRGPMVKPVIEANDYGGTQTVAAGTFTAVMPTPDASNAILRMT